MSTSSRLPSWSSQVILLHKLRLPKFSVLLCTTRNWESSNWPKNKVHQSAHLNAEHPSFRLPLLGSLLHVPHVPGLLTNAAQWFIQRYGKMVSFPLKERSAWQRSLALIPFTGWALPWPVSCSRPLWLWGRKRFVQPRRCIRQKLLSTLHSILEWLDQFQDVLTVLFIDSECLEAN